MQRMIVQHSLRNLIENFLAYFLRQVSFRRTLNFVISDYRGEHFALARFCYEIEMTLVIDGIVQLHDRRMTFDIIFVDRDEVLAILCFQRCFCYQRKHFYFTLDRLLCLGVRIKLIFIINLDGNNVSRVDMHSFTYNCKSTLAKKLTHLVVGNLSVIKSSWKDIVSLLKKVQFFSR